MKHAKVLLKSTMFAVTLVTGALSLPVTAQEQPGAVQELLDRGVTIEATYEAPGGLTGYIGNMQGRAVAFYLTPDGEHVVVGPMLNAKGENLTEPMVQELVLGPPNEKAWSQIEDADWVLDGSADAPVVVYTFTDPNCPFCHRFRQAAEPWIEAGRVQLRHVLVGILKQDSLPKAATILGADNPSAALRKNQKNHSEGGIEVNRQIVSAHAKRVQANNHLMSSLGLSATPSTYYRGSNGHIRMKQGAPRPEEMEAIMGSEAPQ